MNQNHNIPIYKIAHRGVPTLVPENTLASFRKALEYNIDMLEIDVHRTKDNELVIIHDDNTFRTALKKGVVGELTYNQLKQLDVGIWKGKEFANERIPLLKEVLVLVKNLSTKLLIEIKSPKKYPNIEEEILKEIKKENIDINRCVIQSFNIKSIIKTRELNSEIELGVLVKKRNYLLNKRRIQQISTYANYLNPHYKKVSSKMIKIAHQNNLKIMPYTINEKKLMKKYKEMGVDGIITDSPHILSEI